MLTSEYADSYLSGLFQTMLKVGNVNIDILVAELRYMQQLSSPESSEVSLQHATSLYTLINNMANSSESKDRLR